MQSINRPKVQVKIHKDRNKDSLAGLSKTVSTQINTRRLKKNIKTINIK